MSQETTESNPNYGLEKLYALTGMSESGKSSVGRFLDENGVRRLKIVDFLKAIHIRESPNEDFKYWNWRMSDKNPDYLYEQFLLELLSYAQKEQSRRYSIESLYSPNLAHFLRHRLGNKFALVYVDTPEDIRIQRQLIRASFNNLGEARSYMLARDKFKTEQGVPSLKDEAEIILDNSGDINSLHEQIRQKLLR